MSWRKLANRWRGQRLTLGEPAASTSPAPITGNRQPRPWPLLIIGLAAAVAVCSRAELGAVQGDDRDVAAEKAGSRVRREGGDEPATGTRSIRSQSVKRWPSGRPPIWTTRTSRSGRTPGQPPIRSTGEGVPAGPNSPNYLTFRR
jgi:hypothetical protein